MGIPHFERENENIVLKMSQTGLEPAEGKPEFNSGTAQYGKCPKHN